MATLSGASGNVVASAGVTAASVSISATRLRIRAPSARHQERAEDSCGDERDHEAVADRAGGVRQLDVVAPGLDRDGAERVIGAPHGLRDAIHARLPSRKPRVAQYEPGWPVALRRQSHTLG